MWLAERSVGDRCSAAEADQILKVRIRAKAEPFGHITGKPWAEVARAGADEEGVKVLGSEMGFRKR